MSSREGRVARSGLGSENGSGFSLGYERLSSLLPWILATGVMLSAAMGLLGRQGHELGLDSPGAYFPSEVTPMATPQAVAPRLVNPQLVDPQLLDKVPQVQPGREMAQSEMDAAVSVDAAPISAQDQESPAFHSSGQLLSLAPGVTPGAAFETPSGVTSGAARSPAPTDLEQGRFYDGFVANRPTPEEMERSGQKSDSALHELNQVLEADDSDDLRGDISLVEKEPETLRKLVENESIATKGARVGASEVRSSEVRSEAGADNLVHVPAEAFALTGAYELRQRKAKRAQARPKREAAARLAEEMKSREHRDQGGAGSGLPRSPPALPGAAPIQGAPVQDAKSPPRAGRTNQLVQSAESVDIQSGHGVNLDLAQAQAFLADRERTSRLSFAPSVGYWRNTYVPGDPATRLLRARLDQWDRRRLRVAVPGLELEGGVRRNWQPFDPPTHWALAAYLHADKSAVSGPTRLRLQVGLQASHRQSGVRPAMNVALVLDLRQAVTQGDGERMRALVNALAKAKLAGDRFTLMVAGPRGGVYVGPDDFRYGPVQVALRSAFGTKGGAAAPQPGGESGSESGGQPGSESSGAPLSLRPLSLAGAVAKAGRQLQLTDDPSAPLGASLVLIATAGSWGEEAKALQALAHRHAVKGMVTSVAAIGNAALSEVDRLVLYGQGNRRVVSDADDAAGVVDRELHAVSRVVARVVRLSVKLGSEVELISVLGSTPLDRVDVARVRKAERSVDLRVARNLGIKSDRGDDEEGVQIVIPAFYAGDRHVVLLDVLVPGPGPVAQLSVRYKDLVSGRNGVSRSSFHLEAGNSPPGPLELNVVKNHLAQVYAEQIAQASLELTQGRMALARNRIHKLLRLHRGMRRALAQLASDPDLIRDEASLAEYHALLRRGFVGAEPGRFADSMRYAAFAKLLATP